MCVLGDTCLNSSHLERECAKGNDLLRIRMCLYTYSVYTSVCLSVYVNELKNSPVSVNHFPFAILISSSRGFTVRCSTNTLRVCVSVLTYDCSYASHSCNECITARMHIISAAYAHSSTVYVCFNLYVCNECVRDARSIWVAAPLEGRLALRATWTAGG